MTDRGKKISLIALGVMAAALIYVFQGTNAPYQLIQPAKGQMVLFNPNTGEVYKSTNGFGTGLGTWKLTTEMQEFGPYYRWDAFKDVWRKFITPSRWSEKVWAWLGISVFAIVIFRIFFPNGEIVEKPKT